MLLQGMVFSPAGIEVFKQHVPDKFLEAFVHGRAKISGGDSGTSMKANTAIDTAYSASKGEQTVIFSRKWF
jgi:hypothetical protein